VYELLGICLVLTSLLAVNSLASLLVSAVWRVGESRLTNLSAHTRAEILFALRALPPALALLCAAILIVPAYVAYEPRVTHEIVGPKLATLALLSAMGLLFALGRACRSSLATRSLLARMVPSFATD
jgi:hypothetical protein